MKKLKIILLSCFILISAKNLDAKFIKKQTLERAHTITKIATMLDTANQHIPWLKNFRQNRFSYTPFANFTFKINPELKIKIPKILDQIKFDEKDSHFSIHPIGFVSKILGSATEKYDGLLCIFINGILDIEKLKAKYGYDNKDIYLNEGLAILTEEVIKLFTNYYLDIAVKNHRIIKRLIKIITLTSISTLGTYTREKTFAATVKEHLPKVETTALNKLFETLIIEFLGEILQRFIIIDPIKNAKEQEKARFHQRLQEIISGSSSSFFRNNTSNTKEPRNKVGFFATCMP